MNQQYKLSNELEKFAWLKVKLGADDFDAVTLLELIQSETDIEECLLEIGESAVEDEHSVSVIKLRVKELQERASRLEERAEKKRRIISATMCNLKLEKPIQGPTLTLSLRAGGRGVIVTDPTKIPKQYFNDADPKLDKKRLRDALDRGEAIDGAQLPNGGKSVSILVK
jgi:hypothetical protein